jgi:hypothetical protein
MLVENCQQWDFQILYARRNISTVVFSDFDIWDCVILFSSLVCCERHLFCNTRRPSNTAKVSAKTATKPLNKRISYTLRSISHTRNGLRNEWETNKTRLPHPDSVVLAGCVAHQAESGVVVLHHLAPPRTIHHNTHDVFLPKCHDSQTPISAHSHQAFRNLLRRHSARTSMANQPRSLALRPAHRHPRSASRRLGQYVG